MIVYTSANLEKIDSMLYTGANFKNDLKTYLDDEFNICLLENL